MVILYFKNGCIYMYMYIHVYGAHCAEQPVSGEPNYIILPDYARDKVTRNRVVMGHVSQVLLSHTYM